MDMKDRTHLPIFGVGPFLCGGMVLFTGALIALAAFDIIPFSFTNETVKAMLLLVGILFIVFGMFLFFGADFGGALTEDIKHNRLKTNGTYSLVRNPCYCLFFYGCIGAVFMAHNPFLFVIPVILWVAMRIVLKKTEEKWLLEMYGEEYTAYCQRVNRCIPWFHKKEKSDKTEA